MAQNNPEMGKEKTFKVVPCSICGKELKVETTYVRPGEEPALDKEFVYSGAINWWTIGYGSDFDCEKWLIAICDICHRNIKALAVVNYVQEGSQLNREKHEKEEKNVLYQAVNLWQSCGKVHPLTCSNSPCRGSLVPQLENNGQVILRCPACGWIQSWIPEVVRNFKLENLNDTTRD